MFIYSPTFSCIHYPFKYGISLFYSTHKFMIFHLFSLFIAGLLGNLKLNNAFLVILYKNMFNYYKLWYRINNFKLEKRYDKLSENLNGGSIIKSLLCKKSLKFVIEIKRKDMYNKAKNLGFTNPQVVNCSQELDLLLNKYFT